jgi:cysteine-rich repeat protein
MTSSWKAITLAALVTVLASQSHGAIICPASVTQSGGDANDVFIGTADADRINGNGGNDTILGLGGNDCLNGGSFEDQVFGGTGDDNLSGEGGNDLLDGGPGDDDLNGGSENDTMYGGTGNDRLFGEGGGDFLDGGDGDDFLNGGSDNDTLRGGLGRDAVFGEGGDDTILVQAGDVPAGAEETLSGDDGFDTAALDFDPGPVTLPDFDVIDPGTHGTYHFRSIERIIIDRCGNGVVGPGEQCDDGNRGNGDGCDSNCTRTACGNRVVSAGEQCDDGNTVGGDGCDADCQREQCPNGKDANGECIPKDPGDPNTSQECAGSCDDGDNCTTDTCRNATCVSQPLPTLDRAICDVAELRASCVLELSHRKRLTRKLKKVTRILRLVKAGGAPSRLDRANRIVLAVQKRALKMVTTGKTRQDCSKAIDLRLVDLSAAVNTLRAK